MRKRTLLVAFALASLLTLFFAVPFLEANSNVCYVEGDMGFSRPTSHLVSLSFYVIGDGAVLADGGYTLAFLGGRLPC